MHKPWTILPVFVLCLAATTSLQAQHAVKFEAKLHRSGAPADLKTADGKSVVFGSVELIPKHHRGSGIVTMQLPAGIHAKSLGSLTFAVRLGGSSKGIKGVFEAFHRGDQKWVQIDTMTVNDAFEDHLFKTEDVLSIVDSKTNQIEVRIHGSHDEPFSISIDRLLFRGKKGKPKPKK